MSDCYVGEIRIWPAQRIPTGWALCDGREVSINDYNVLFALIGTTYGGDGASTFKLPDLRGRLPIGQGSGVGLTPRVIGQTAGSETVTLQQAQLPAHNHPLQASAATATATTPDSTMILASPTSNFYAAPTPSNPSPALADAAVSPAFNAAPQPHANMMPSAAINYIIALVGAFPQQQ